MKWQEERGNTGNEWLFYADRFYIWSFVHLHNPVRSFSNADLPTININYQWQSKHLSPGQATPNGKFAPPQGAKLSFE